MSDLPSATFDVDRYLGCLLGLAVGDALGTTLEFQPKDSGARVEDMVGGGPFDLPPGYWTDDTSMAMCLAESLIDRGGFDPLDQMTRYSRWRREGYWSSLSYCFDIGVTIAAAIRTFEETGNPIAGSLAPQHAGNGSLMRLAPVPLRYARNPADAVHYAAESSRPTHGTAEAVDACRYFAALIVGALHGAHKRELLAPRFAPAGVDWTRAPLAPAIDRIAAGSYKAKQESDIRASGYVVHTLEAALWAFHGTETFEEGALAAVNLGEDADTTGAVYGQLAGAYYGAERIPARWRGMLARHFEIEHLAIALHRDSGNAE